MPLNRILPAPTRWCTRFPAPTVAPARFSLYKFFRKKFCPTARSRDVEEARARANLNLVRASRWVVKFKIAVSFMQVCIWVEGRGRALCERGVCFVVVAVVCVWGGVA